MSGDVARWGRLAATLAEHGHTVTVDQHRFAEIVFGRVRRGVTCSVTVLLADGGGTVEIHDQWWHRNPDTWIGWQVHVADAEGIVRRTFPRTKNRSEVAEAFAAALSDAHDAGAQGTR